MPYDDEAPPYSAIFGVIGASFAMVGAAFGSAYGTAKAGAGIAAMAVSDPKSIMKALIPVVMAGNSFFSTFFNCASPL